MITDIQPFLIGELDKNLRYVFVNEAYVNWFKTPRENILRTHIRDLLGEKAFLEVHPHLQKALHGQKTVFEIKVFHRGRPDIVQCTYSPGFDANGDVDSIYISVIDITDLRKTMDSLNEEIILRQKFMSTLSHDLRTPLTAAKMSADIMARKVSDEADKKLVNRISENLKRVNFMIEDLLDVSKIRAGQDLQAELQEFDLSETVFKTIEDLTAIYGDKFTLEIPEKMNVYLDPNAIRRILENLCGNAVKYGPPDDKVSVLVTIDSETVSLAVKNKGSSLINTDKEKLFKPFQRGPEDSIAGKKGWGIGLTIVKGLAAALKGEVDVVSTQKETIFTVKLPRDARDADQNQSYFH